MQCHLVPLRFIHSFYYIHLPAIWPIRTAIPVSWPDRTASRNMVQVEDRERGEGEETFRVYSNGWARLIQA
jgi:hypothetical protein